MFYCLIFVYFLLNVNSALTYPSCSLVNQKLSRYQSIERMVMKNSSEFDVRRSFCHSSLSNKMCCSSKHEELFQNATASEIRELFEQNSRSLNEVLVEINLQLNETLVELIEKSRREVHEVFQRDHPMIYQSFRSWIDDFYRNLLSFNSKNSQYEIKMKIEDLFRHLLRLVYSPRTSSKSLTCLWQHQPFSDRPTRIGEQIEFYFRKLIELNELIQLNRESLQILSTTVKNDFHCLDFYIQLSYCNLCADRTELPCLSNCLDVIESCFVNITLINDVWRDFLGIFENLENFYGIERNFLSFGLSISDALITFLKSDKFQQRYITEHCGQNSRREELGTNDRPFLMKYNHSLSFVDRQLSSIKESLEFYRSFWLILPNEICQSNGVAAPLDTQCWTGNSISTDRRQRIRSNYDKPLNLRLQWLFKEIREKSKRLRTKLSTLTGNKIADVQVQSAAEELSTNTKDSSHDDPNDQEFDYSDYAYEDTSDDLSTISTTTARLSSAVSLFDDESVDDVHTVAYYDYQEQDAYSDEETDGSEATKSTMIISGSGITTSIMKMATTTTKTTKSFTTTMTTTTNTLTTTTTTIRKRIKTTTNKFMRPTFVVHIPAYHRRKPIVWNVSTDEQRKNSAFSLTHSFIIFFLWLPIKL